MSDFRIGLIDNNDLVRAGHAMIFNSQIDMRVVLEESDPMVAIERAPNYLVDVVLVGPSQQRLRGDQFVHLLAEAFRSANNDCAIIAYSAFASKKLRFEAIRAGAQDFIGLDSTGTEFLSLTRAVVKRDYLVDPKILKEMFDEFGGMPRSNIMEQKISELNDLQTKIVNLFLTGIGDQAIAKKLDIARTRVTQLIDSLLKAADLTSRSQLALTLIGYNK